MNIHYRRSKLNEFYEKYLYRVKTGTSVKGVSLIDGDAKQIFTTEELHYLVKRGYMNTQYDFYTMTQKGLIEIL